MGQGSEKPGGFEELEHTADVALRVYGRDLQELFIHAAEGMFHLIGDCERDAPPYFEDDFRLEAPDREALLIDWLNELLYLSETQDVCYYAFEIRDLSSTSLDARVSGNSFALHKREIKAATFHELRIEEMPNGLEVTIVFDM